MKWQILFYVIILVLCLVYLPNLNSVFGQTTPATPADLVFKEYQQTLLRADIRPLLPNLLNAFRESDFQEILETLDIEVYLSKPIFLRALSANIDDQFIALLYVDDDLRKLFGDEQFFKVLKEDSEIDKLLRLLREPDGLTVDITSSVTKTPVNYDNFTINVNIIGGKKINRYLIQVEFDSAAISYVENYDHGFNGDYLPDACPSREDIEKEIVTIEAESPFADNSGDGVLATLTFEVKTIKASIITLLKVDLFDSNGALWTLEPNKEVMILHPADANEDGNINVSDFHLVSQNIGITGKGDVNEDKIVDIYDIVFVLGVLFETEKVPTIAEFITELEEDVISVSDIQEWHNQAQVLDLSNLEISKAKPIYERGIDVLNDLIAGFEPSIADVNEDGQVNPQDFNLVVQALGLEGSDRKEDVNGDDKVDILDLILVAGELGDKESEISMLILAQKKLSERNVRELLNQVEEFESDVPEEIKVTREYQLGIAALKEALLVIISDVNGDGTVNIQDLVLVANKFGESGEDLPEDINRDGTVNIQDLVLVASKFGIEFGQTTPAPSILSHAVKNISTADVQIWLTQAKAFNPNISETTKTHPAYQRGIAVLENLLTSLIQTETEPKRTALLLNYPNPFNPETWIPYQLAEATNVNVTIHAMNGSLIRTLSLGHQVAGVYRSKSRAAYWDGKNEFGERVASGLYFYTLTAGNFSATHKMLIRK